MTKYDSQHGAMIAFALLGIIDNLSTVLTLGRYSLLLEEKALYSGNPDEATFCSVIRSVVSKGNES